MEHPQELNPATRFIGGGIFLVSVVGLYFQVTEPFAGGRLAYAGRLLGPITIMLVGLYLFLQRPAHPLFVALVFVLGLLSLGFVLAGLAQ